MTLHSIQHNRIGVNPPVGDIHFVSISGGKDSQATAIVCLDQHADDDVRFVFFDNGNEHVLTYSHLDYLEDRLQKPIERLKPDFSADLERKRNYILTHWPDEGIAPDIVSGAIAALVPTGIPFLDLCLLKGRFPSSQAQFCTQELKRRVFERYIVDAILENNVAVSDVHSWQGIRRDESERRKNVAEREQVAEGWWIERPIATWTEQQVVDLCRERNVNLNPLYSLGMRRVGCMPCINAGKDELLEISKRFPEVIDKVREWERMVGIASKRGRSSFFAAPDKDGRGEREGRNIDERLAWAQTSHGGRQFDLLRRMPAEICSSSYGLCEAPA